MDMSHLPDERLAALFDDPPSSAELAHLASCERCSAERAAYRALRELANADQARIGAPISSWETLAPALRADGVIDTGEWLVARRYRRLRAERAGERGHRRHRDHYDPARPTPHRVESVLQSIQHQKLFTLTPTGSDAFSCRRVASR